MPTFDTPNSQHSYTVPDDAAGVAFTVRGGAGGAGGGAGTITAPGGGGEVVAELRDQSVAGETLTVYVGQQGEDGQDSSSFSDLPGGGGGTSPVAGGVSGGDAGTSDGEYSGSGGGGAPSAIERSGTVLALGAGGGGGLGAPVNGTVGDGPGGGGGGARGGAGGRGADGPSGDATDGQPGDGSGRGGAGASAYTQDDSQDDVPATDGGTTTDNSLAAVATGASTTAPVVKIEPLYPPAPPTNLTADAVRNTEIDISWTDDSLPDTDPASEYRIYKSRDGGTTETQVATLSGSTTSYTLTGLKNGEEYRIAVEAVNNVASRRDWRGFTTAPGTTRTVGATETVNRDNPYENGGTVENRGEINVNTDFEL